MYGRASVYARNILLALNELEYDKPILLPNLMKSAKAFEEYHELMNIQDPKQIEIYPNPSDDYVIIQYSLEIESNSAIIEVANINGTIVKAMNIYGKQDQLVVNTQNWKPGIYIATLKMNGNIKENAKFTIVK